MLNIVVQDENDNPPEFIKSSYLVSIGENNPANSDVIQVIATSKDIGVNAEMSYMISAGNVDESFTIDPDNGKFDTCGQSYFSCKILYVLYKFRNNPTNVDLASVNFQYLLN